MPDPSPAVPVYTSGCGSVTIDLASASPVVRLSLDAVRLPVRNLAELITCTAWDAADAVRGSGAEQPLGSIAGALAELGGLRDELSEADAEAVLARGRSGFGAEAPDRPGDDPRAAPEPAGEAGAFPAAGLDAAIGLLERHRPAPGTAPADGGEAEAPTGKATSPDEQVIVEATGAYPIARLRLGVHAREMGPELLAAQISATAALAAEDLEKRQRARIGAMGPAFTREQIDRFPARMRAYAKQTAGRAPHQRRRYGDASDRGGRR